MSLRCHIGQGQQTQTTTQPPSLLTMVMALRTAARKPEPSSSMHIWLRSGVGCTIATYKYYVAHLNSYALNFYITVTDPV